MVFRSLSDLTPKNLGRDFTRRADARTAETLEADKRPPGKSLRRALAAELEALVDVKAIEASLEE